ncbi:MAG: formate dehydrogenase accessory sulfurtransferase FdhD [Actinomycetota bacterium]
MTTEVPIRRSVTRARAEREEHLATEEPMEIRVEGAGGTPPPVAVTMRTPGHDFELAAGFLWSEALVDDPAAVRRVSYCEDLPPQEQRYNVVTVELATPFVAPTPRPFAVAASCGVCGKATLDEVEVRCAPLGPGPRIDAAVLAGFPERLREDQSVFERTGGLHAAGLFTPDGRLLVLREDVGRHNAVDKVIGRALLAGDLPLDDAALQVSGRVSFEIVQKAARAGIAVVAAVSAPSSLAVEAAERLGVTLAGFVREGRATLYAHPERIG